MNDHLNPERSNSSMSTPEPITVTIKGYRQLSAEEQARINRIKELGEQLRTELEHDEAAPANDKRWLAIAKTDLQKGLMSWVRGIAQPTTF
jgi:hypothetical protein